MLPSKLVPHKAGMLGKFDSKKDSYSRTRVLIKINFRERCDSKLFGLRTFDVIVIGFKNDIKSES